MVKYLISLGVDIRTQPDYIIADAAGGGHIDMMIYLKSLGLDVMSLLDEAMAAAALGGHIEMVKYIIWLGADINTNADELMARIAMRGQLEMFKYLESLGFSVDRYALNYTAADVAQHGYLDMLKYLMMRGANIFDPKTCAITRAAIGGQIHILKYFASLGVDIRAYVDVCYHLAKLGTCNAELIKYMASLGVDIRENLYFSISDFVYHDNREMIEYYKSLGAIVPDFDKPADLL
jgi:hypothetical protein